MCTHIAFFGQMLPPLVVLHILICSVKDLIVGPARQHCHFQKDETFSWHSSRQSELNEAHVASQIKPEQILFGTLLSSLYHGRLSAQQRHSTFPSWHTAFVTISQSPPSSSEAYCKASPSRDTAFVTISRSALQSVSIFGHCCRHYLTIASQRF